jgi:hypothetical protein
MATTKVCILDSTDRRAWFERLWETTTYFVPIPLQTDLRGRQIAELPAPLILECDAPFFAYATTKNG